MKQQRVNLEKFMQAHFDAAKFWFMLATICALLVLGLDIFVTLTNRFAAALALVAALLTILSGILQWRSAILRGVAESVLRKFELHRGLGWEISSREIKDLLAVASKPIREAAYSDTAETYFTSSNPKPVEKLLENLQESAWFTKIQAKRMTIYSGIFSVFILALAFITLVVALQSALSQTSANNVAKITIAIIVFVFSGGYVRLAFDYNQLAQEAGRAEEKACDMQKKSYISEVEAVKLLHDYQIARASAPLLPNWLWRFFGEKWTALWEQHIN
jgi:hypothetical protein